ncbi:C-type lectin domain family 4 member F-like [Aplysia californica]|uniref:C-type lectin domain family 4 member F-like n=1 Tax=Aplysia californica TaxID=6500 RepID=A0ABM0JFD9_APLCA|nr:C-type lectin domain family 4 member F-like [Aplysia californica]
MGVRDDVPPPPQDGQSIHKYKKLYILTRICVIVTSLLVSSAAVVVIVHTVRADRADVLTAINQVSANIRGVQEKLEEKVSDDVNKAPSLDRADVLTALNQVSTNITGQLSAVKEKVDNLEEKVSKVEDVVTARSKLKLCSHGNGCEMTSRLEAMTHCYKVFEEETSWADARKKCESLGGFLAEIHDNVSLEYVNRVVAKDSLGLWLGATDQDKEGIWKWVTSNKPLSVEDWNKNEPNSFGGNEHCLEIRQEPEEKGWNDRACHRLVGYLCQRDGDNCEDWLEQE